MSRSYYQKAFKAVFTLLILSQSILIWSCFGSKLDVEPPLKYQFVNFSLCEKCEEKAKVVYELQNKKLCPRCTLEHL